MQFCGRLTRISLFTVNNFVSAIVAVAMHSLHVCCLLVCPHSKPLTPHLFFALAYGPLLRENWLIQSAKPIDVPGRIPV